MTSADKLVPKLREIVGEPNIIREANRLKTYALDAKVPKVAVLPGSREEISEVVAWANQEKLSILPRGNGTKMGMGAIPRNVDVVLLMSRMNRIIDKDCDNLTLSAEAGMTLGEVQKILANQGKGYFLPLDPPYTEKATLGGIVATNGSGPRRFANGTARDLIIGLKAVFPNGDLVATGGKTVKNVSGYDLGKLLIGSMGTLGILCEMTFRLLPLPEKEATLLVYFETLGAAQHFVHDVIHSQLVPVSVEVLSAAAFRKVKYPLSGPASAKYLVAIGLEGVTETIDRQVKEMGEMGKKRGCLESSVLSAKQNQSFWIGLRDMSLGLSGEYPNLITLKSNFVISKWAEVLGSYEKIGQELGVECAFSGHAGNGVLHSHLLVGKDFPSKAKALLDLIGKMTAEAVKNEGNLVVESAPVLIKEKVNVWGQTRNDCRVVRRLKEEIDPMGVLNPGRFVGGV